MLGLKWKIRDFVYMLLASIFILIVFTTYFYASTSKMVIVDEHNPKAQSVLKPVDGDFIIGDKNAPVEVVFYGDFTCHHCMRFMKDTFLRLRDEYIFTGKIKFIFRPVITLKRSLFGAKFLFCENRLDDKNAEILFEMFEKKWMLSEDYVNSLSKLVEKNKWDTKSHFIECINSKEIKDNLHKLYQNTVKPLNIHETPHIFINKKPYSADISIFKMIDKEYNIAIRANHF